MWFSSMFNSNIYEDVKDNADEIWKFEKYDMIMEFHWKPALPIPFSIIPNLWRIFKRVIHSICSSFGNERRRGKVYSILLILQEQTIESETEIIPAKKINRNILQSEILK